VVSSACFVTDLGTVPTLIRAPAAFLLMLAVKQLAKAVGLYPTTRIFAAPRQEGMDTTPMMSNGPDVRHGLVPLRPFAWDHRSMPALRAGRSRDRKCRRADADCERLLPNPASAPGWERGRIGTITPLDALDRECRAKGGRAL